MRILDLEHIPVIRAECEPLEFDSMIDAASMELDLDPKVLVFEKGVRVKGVVHYFTDNILVIATVTGVQKMVCSRCLEDFKRDFIKSVQLSFEPQGEKLINALPELSEEILSEAPINVLCKYECKGLCAGCGQNLNREVCRCR